MVRLLLTLLIFMLPRLAFSQIENVTKFLEVGICPLSYKGDLSQGYQKWGSAFQLGLKKNIKKRFNGHFNLMLGSVSGQNPTYSYPNNTPNQYFKTSFVSFNYDLQFNIIKKDHFILYISQGIGLMRFTVKDDLNEDLNDKFSTRARNETYNNIAFLFPHSIGMMYFLKNNYGTGLQIGRLSPATDYMDNISQLSTFKKPDNILLVRFSFVAPLSYKK